MKENKVKLTLKTVKLTTVFYQTSLGVLGQLDSDFRNLFYQFKAGDSKLTHTPL